MHSESHSEEEHHHRSEDRRAHRRGRGERTPRRDKSGRYDPRDFTFPGPQRRRKGAARDAILSLLAEKPFNGYGLIKEISDRAGDTWHPSPGSVYPTLQQLVDEGLIEATNEETPTDFQLTTDGREYVSAHAVEFAQLWQSAAADSEAHGDFRESIGKLMAVAHQYRFVATPEQRTQAVTLIDETRRALYRILGE